MNLFEATKEVLKKRGRNQGGGYNPDNGSVCLYAGMCIAINPVALPMYTGGGHDGTWTADNSQMAHQGLNFLSERLNEMVPPKDRKCPHSPILWNDNSKTTDDMVFDLLDRAAAHPDASRFEVNYGGTA